MPKGDRIRVLLDGDFAIQEIVADKAGRSVSFERNDKQNLITVEVTGRAGTVARTVLFRADRVVMLEEVPA